MGAILSFTGATCDPSSVFGLRVPARRLGRIRRQPGLHHRQPGRRLWRRPVPRQGREMRRACRAVLLPVARFRPGLVLSARRSRTKSPGRFPRRPATPAAMPAATNTSPLPASAEPSIAVTSGCRATPAPRKRRDAAPRSGYVRPRWPRLRFQPRGIALMAGYA